MTNATHGLDDVQATKLMTISTFSRRSLLSLKALRLYERIGLLVPATVDLQSGYRFYSEDQLPTARMIVMLRRLDMPLADITGIVSATGDDAAMKLASYWDGVEARVAGQRELASYLHARLAGTGENTGMFRVEARNVPEQRLLTETHAVTIADVPRTLAEASGRLIQQALGVGGLRGHVFVIYHGVVDEDSTGLIEVCVPIGAWQRVPEGVAWRNEPAHREAFAVLRKAQFAYPQILTAYDAVAKWGADHGGVVGPAREIYYPGFPDAGPLEDAAEIACPIGFEASSEA